MRTTIMNLQVKPVIREFIEQSLLFGTGADSLGDDTSLLESGTIDSTGILELVTFLEERFKFRIADEEVVPENLDSISLIAKFVESKLNSANFPN